MWNSSEDCATLGSRIAGGETQFGSVSVHELVCKSQQKRKKGHNEKHVKLEKKNHSAEKEIKERQVNEDVTRFQFILEDFLKKDVP